MRVFAAAPFGVFFVISAAAAHSHPYSILPNIYSNHSGCDHSLAIKNSTDRIQVYNVGGRILYWLAYIDTENAESIGRIPQVLLVILLTSTIHQCSEAGYQSPPHRSDGKLLQSTLRRPKPRQRARQWISFRLSQRCTAQETSSESIKGQESLAATARNGTSPTSFPRSR